MTTFDLRPIGRVVSPLTDASTAPRQPDEGAPSAWLHFDVSVLDAQNGKELKRIRTGGGSRALAVVTGNPSGVSSERPH